MTATRVLGAAPPTAVVPLDGERPRPAARIVEAVLAILALGALGSRIELISGVTVGLVVAVVLAPVWLVHLRTWFGARTLLTVGALAAVAGVWLTQLASYDHVTTATNTRAHLALLLSVLTGVGVVLWARSLMATRWIALSYGAGMLADALVSDGFSSGNPWKFALAVPVTVILLGAVDGQTRRLLQLAALLLLAAVSALQDSRSYFAAVLLAAALFLYRCRPLAGTRTASGAWTAGMIGVAALAIYQLGTTLVLGGYLGEEAQRRSVTQLDTSGSLLLGGRPELAATLSLMRDQPLGFGAGTVPNLGDILVAKSGMATLGYQPNNGYVENFMFGGEFKLHSVVGDLWASYGFAGLALAGLLTFLLLRSVSITVADRTATALPIMMVCWTMWNLPFSPLYSTAPSLLLALGLGLTRRSTSPPRPT